MSTSRTSTEACVDFLQRLIRTRSMPGEEADIAALVRAEMEALDYDDVDVDDAGNVIGLVEGRGSAPSVMFNTHLDHVDAGDPEHWPHPPFEGEIHDGRVWGRGAVDIKGPLAAQVYGVARLVEPAERPDGNVYVTAVVQEEVGGLGARSMAGTLRPDLILVGEPSRNEVRRGHRGRVELHVRVRGKMAHASMTDIGVNPLTVIGRFLAALPGIPLPDHPELGGSTIAPTLIGTDQTSPNVIPGEVSLTLDCRTVPGQTGEALRELLLSALRAAEIAGSETELVVPDYEHVSYTGHRLTYSADNPAYALAADDPAVRSAVATLAGVLGGEPPVDVWKFATDGGHFAEAGLTVVGFGPGDDRLAHTVNEAIGIDELETGIAGNEALARGWAVAYEAARG